VRGSDDSDARGGGEKGDDEQGRVTEWRAASGSVESGQQGERPAAQGPHSAPGTNHKHGQHQHSSSGGGSKEDKSPGSNYEEGGGESERRGRKRAFKLIAHRKHSS